jgi:hypothetical protein
MIEHFKSNKFSNLRRQLNLFGFIYAKSNEKSWSHEYFKQVYVYNLIHCSFYFVLTLFFNKSGATDYLVLKRTTAFESTLRVGCAEDRNDVDKVAQCSLIPNGLIHELPKGHMFFEIDVPRDDFEKSANFRGESTSRSSTLLALRSLVPVLDHVPGENDEKNTETLEESVSDDDFKTAIHEALFLHDRSQHLSHQNDIVHF